MGGRRSGKNRPFQFDLPFQQALAVAAPPVLNANKV
jgi:hypothetical protein